MNLRLYILARKDASIGKIMAHIGHVCCLVMREFAQISLSVVLNDKYLDEFDRNYGKELEMWFKHSNQTKIILEIDNEEDIYNFQEKFETKTHTYSIRDLHTKEKYCLAIGPINKEQAKKLGLNKLSLYNR